MTSSLAAASWLGELTDEDITARVGEITFLRGANYHDADMVTSITAADRGRIILGEVEGTRPLPYQVFVTASLEEGRSARWASRCSCPMQAECKHTVAVLLKARDGYQRSHDGDRQAEPTWESALRWLVDDSREPVDTGPPLGLLVDPLPVATNYRAMMGPPRIALRPTRKTKTGSWARNLTWAELTSPHSRTPMSKRHLAALRAIHDLHRVAGGRDGYFYSTGDLYLGALGPRVWPLLRHALQSGVELLPGPNLHGELTLAPEPVVLGLDVVRDDEEIVVTPRLDGAPALDRVHEITLLGEPPHGVAVTHGDGLTLMGFDGELDPHLADLIARQRVLRIPGADTERFVNLYLPKLHRATTVTSSDASVTVPEPPRPVVRVRVRQPTPRYVELRFDIAYEASAGGALLTLDGGVPLPRDRTAEQTLLGRLELLDGIPSARVRRGTTYSGFWELAARVTLHAMEAVRFVEDTLPRLEEEADVVVIVEDELTAYEQADVAPLVEVGLRDSADGTTDWFDLAITVSVGGEQVPFEPLFRALAAGDDAMLLDSGLWFTLDDPALDSLRTLITEARELSEPNRPLRLSRFHIGLWDDLADLGLTSVTSTAWTDSVNRLRDIAEGEPLPPPEGLLATLRPYQLDGYRWLRALWAADLGGVLADDMGLGKTVQMLALLAHAKSAGDLDGPVLVVAPTSMLGVWAAEASRFAPDLAVVVLGETTRRRGGTVAEAVTHADLVVTSYAVARIDGDSFAEQSWRGLILDEAQFVKNPQAKTHRVLRTLRARFRVAMTGTPLENSLMDLWSLLALVAPGLYPRADIFNERYRRPIESGEAPEMLERLRRRVRPLMLRRTKEAVAADLPPKQEQVLPVELHPVHRRIYDQHLQRERQRVLGLLGDPNGNRVAILAALTRLRQLSLDPALVDPQRHGGTVPAKVESLIENLTELAAEGHRALVFSQFTSFLKNVEGHLADAGITTAYLDGSTRNRAEAIRGFREGDATAFLISLKAGGVGLTLTEADYVFVLDPWWNPAAEAQAIDRAHRIGQDKMVMVYRLISTGTIEEKVVALQRRKRDLFDRVVDDGGAMSGAITADDIRALLDAD